MIPWSAFGCGYWHTYLVVFWLDEAWQGAFVPAPTSLCHLSDFTWWSKSCWECRRPERTSLCKQPGGMGGKVWRWMLKRNPETRRFGDDPAPFETFLPTGASPFREPKTRRKQIPKTPPSSGALPCPTTDSSFAPNSTLEAETTQSTCASSAERVPDKGYPWFAPEHNATTPKSRSIKLLGAPQRRVKARGRSLSPQEPPRPGTLPLHPTFYLVATSIPTSCPAHPPPRPRQGYSNDSSGRCNGKQTYRASRAGSSTTTTSSSGR